MCETSNTPAAVLTARCSSITPSYWTGISHPANGTRRAPAARWASNRGVRRRSASPSVDMPPRITPSSAQEGRDVDVVVADLERRPLAVGDPGAAIARRSVASLAGVAHRPPARAMVEAGADHGHPDVVAVALVDH